MLSVRCWQFLPLPSGETAAPMWSCPLSRFLRPGSWRQTGPERLLWQHISLPLSSSSSCSPPSLVGPQWYSQHLAAQWLQGGELGESDSASADLGSVHLCFFTFSIALFLPFFNFVFIIILYLKATPSARASPTAPSAAMVSAAFLVGMFWTGLTPDWDRHQLARNGKRPPGGLDAWTCGCQEGGGTSIDWTGGLMKSTGDVSVGGATIPRPHWLLLFCNNSLN